MTDDLPIACCPVHLLARYQSSAFKVSLARILFSIVLSSFPLISVLNPFHSMCSSSLLICSYQVDFLFLEVCATIVVLRLCSFQIFSLLVTPFFVYRSCRFVVANVSASYTIAGLVSFAGILLRTILSYISSNFSNLVLFAL